MKKLHINERLLNEILDNDLNISNAGTTNNIGTNVVTTNGTMEFGEVEPTNTDDVENAMVANTFYNRRWRGGNNFTK